MEQRGGARKEKKKKTEALTFTNELIRDCHFSAPVACVFFFCFSEIYQKELTAK
jgi:hypothetical protein